MTLFNVGSPGARQVILFFNVLFDFLETCKNEVTCVSPFYLLVSVKTHFILDARQFTACWAKRLTANVFNLEVCHKPISNLNKYSRFVRNQLSLFQIKLLANQQFRHFPKTTQTSLLFSDHRRSKILYNKYVVQVEYGSPLSVTVRCTDGTVYQADWVISTFSLGVLQHKVVNFVPAFPGWKTRELNRFVMGAHTKIFLEFPNTFWGNKEFILRVAERRGHFPLLTDLKTRS